MKNNFFINLIKKISKKTFGIYLENNISRLTYIACAISKENIEILESKDNFGGYYKNKILLPKKIELSKKEKKNYIIYLFKLVFFLTSKKHKFYLPEDKSNIDYIFLSTLVTIKIIHKTMIKSLPGTKKIINELYNLINKNRNITKKRNKSFLLELVFKKLTYYPIYKINIFLNNIEKKWLYDFENVDIKSEIDFKLKLKSLYNKLILIYPKNEKIELNPLWGYLYFLNKIKQKQNQNKDLFEKNTIKKELDKKNINIININLKKNKQNINLIFDHSKTVDEYKSGNKTIDGDSENINSNILNELNINNTTRYNSECNSLLKAHVLNQIGINNTKNKKKINVKRFLYDEWNFYEKKYKKNWCNVYVKKLTEIKEKFTINKIINEKKKTIFILKEKLKFILNKKNWKNRQKQGEEIDFDTVIDNYMDIKNNLCEKIFKHKKLNDNDLSISILIDSSLSTDSYFKNKKIINRITELVVLLSCSINSIIKYFSISIFYSNTRHDCRYENIKDFKDKWDIEKYKLVKLIPKGYTRIGPAIRHSTYNINKIKTKKKLILLISDGKPTDYDEYEGEYGITDVKCATKEAKKKKIDVKSLIIDDIPRIYFPKMLGIKNYQLVKSDNFEIPILKLLYDTINQ